MKSNRPIIRRPIITEKATKLKEKSNQYVFEVENDCNKIEIRQEIEKQFKVKVMDVHTYSTHGKTVVRGKSKGRKSDWKRAIVKLKEGDTIEFFEGA
jgi:large subunit ribosomal protein L23